MPWYQIVVCFFGGVFLANFVPHFVSGILGQEFYSPFANPPFRGLSSPRVNILWGLFNLSVSYALLILIGEFELRSITHVIASIAGLGLASIGIAGSIGRMRSNTQALGSVPK
jgi:hypothetical protein